MSKWGKLEIKPTSGFKQNLIPTPEFVQTHLAPHVVKKSPKSWFIKCPYHSEQDGSLSVIVTQGHSKAVGFWKCFGCGRNGYWDILAETLNMPLVDGMTLDLNETESICFKNEDTVTVEIGPNIEPWPTAKNWRGFTGKLLSKHGALYNSQNADYPLLFPCYFRGSTKLCGYTTCRYKKAKKSISYIHSKGPWITKYLWPEHIALKSKLVILVEGQRDCLALRSLGYNALAALGTQSGINEQRINTLLSLGATHILLCMDNDEAGYLATYGKQENDVTTKVGMKALLDKDFRVHVFPIWDFFTYDIYGKTDMYLLATKPHFKSFFIKWLTTQGLYKLV